MKKPSQELVDAYCALRQHYQGESALVLAERGLDKARQDCQAAQRGFVAAERATAAARRKLEAIRDARDRLLEPAMADLAQLAARPEVAGIDIEASRMLVFTKPLVLAGRGIGSLKLTVPRDAEDIRLTNLTGLVDGFVHPWADRQGYLLPAPALEDCALMIGQGRPAAAALKLLDLLVSQQDLTPCQPLESWPQADQDWLAGNVRAVVSPFPFRQDWSRVDSLIGLSVRIRRDSKFACQTDGVGQVVSTVSSGKKGWVKVAFGSYVNGYRVGLPDVESGACDLELAGQVPEEFQVGLDVPERFVERFQADYLDFCRLEGRPVRQAESEVQKCEGLSAAAVTQLTEALARLDRAHLQVIELGQGLDRQNRQVWTGEIAAILAHPDITKAEALKTVLKVWTKDIFIRVGRDDIKIGQFEITLDPRGDSIRMKNLTGRRPRDGVHHPHVSSDGRPCLGNMSEVFSQALRQNQFPALVSMAVEFLKSYTCEDHFKPYANISSWI